MRLIENADRKKNKIIDSAPFPSTDVDKVSSLLKKCPVASKTPLLELENFLPQGKLLQQQVVMVIQQMDTGQT